MTSRHPFPPIHAYSGNTYLPHMQVDCANGVGAMQFSRLATRIPEALQVTLCNTGDGGLNEQVGIVTGGSRSPQRGQPCRPSVEDFLWRACLLACYLACLLPASPYHVCLHHPASLMRGHNPAAQCGADYVKLYQRAPSGMEVADGERCAVFDGDADRVLYFYTQDGQFVMLVGVQM